MDRLSWRAGSGDLGDWLAEIFDRFAVSPEGFTVQRGGKKTPRYDGAPNGRPYDQEISRTYPRTVDALVSGLGEDNVREVGFTVDSPDWWWLWARPHDRSKTDWIKVTMPGTRMSNWPLPATLRDGRDLRRLLGTLAGMLGTAPPDYDVDSARARYSQPVEIKKRVSSDTYWLWVTGWGHETLSLRGETVRLVGDLSRLFGPRGPTPLPLDSLGSLAHLYETLMVELGRRWAIRWAEPLPIPDDVRLPPDARLTVTRTPGADPSLQVTAEELLIEADHPAHSLRERITLLLCPQLYTPCAPADLPNWLRSLEKGVFGRSGIWTVRGQGWRPPQHRGAATVARALLEQGVTGRASVGLAGAEFLTVQGLLLGGEPVELAGRSRVKR
ncbi:hypothetical protein GCM10022225_50230 [Plantactinospora mayteni]|uniref:Transcriptional regulator n=1 Tax=Plantactinospora mayteni TaxID=566021 RepID=A0ABQ4EY12_9ACTN|nr:hypothetical protein [Plantactinospora mayteni]GIG99521.1 hypothetical protein Pma05_60940 [Plantactinospora mayteni]